MKSKKKSKVKNPCKNLKKSKYKSIVSKNISSNDLILNDDCWLQVFSFLTSAQLIHVRTVSHRWETLVRAEFRHRIRCKKIYLKQVNCASELENTFSELHVFYIHNASHVNIALAHATNVRYLKLHLTTRAYQFRFASLTCLQAPLQRLSLQLPNDVFALAHRILRRTTALQSLHTLRIQCDNYSWLANSSVLLNLLLQLPNLHTLIIKKLTSAHSPPTLSKRAQNELGRAQQNAANACISLHTLKLPHLELTDNSLLTLFSCLPSLQVLVLGGIHISIIDSLFSIIKNSLTCLRLRSQSAICVRSLDALFSSLHLLHNIERLELNFTRFCLRASSIRILSFVLQHAAHLHTCTINGVQVTRETFKHVQLLSRLLARKGDCVIHALCAFSEKRVHHHLLAVLSHSHHVRVSCAKHMNKLLRLASYFVRIRKLVIAFDCPRMDAMLNRLSRFECIKRLQQLELRQINYLSQDTLCLILNACTSLQKLTLRCRHRSQKLYTLSIECWKALGQFHQLQQLHFQNVHVSKYLLYVIHYLPSLFYIKIITCTGVTQTQLNQALKTKMKKSPLVTNIKSITN